MREKSARVIDPELSRKATGPERSRRGFASVLILVVLALGVAAGAVAIFQLRSKVTPKPEPTQVSQLSQSPTPTQATSPAQKDETANWKTYINENLKFSLKYPPRFILNNYIYDNDQVFFHESQTEKNKFEACLNDTRIYDKTCSNYALSIRFISVAHQYYLQALEGFKNKLVFIDVDGNPAFYRTKAILQGSITDLYIDKGNHALYIYSHSGINDQENMQTYIKMISTLKFLD